MRQAGAEALLVGRNQLAWMSDEGSAPPLQELVRLFFSEADLIIVEGYRSAGLPTILVERPGVDDPTWHRPEESRIITTAHPNDVESTSNLLVEHLGLSANS